MHISSQLFDRIVGARSGASRELDRKPAVLPVGCRRASERREAARMAFGQRTPVCRDRGRKAGVWDTVMMQDISLSGIGFLCHDAMDVGDTFVMKVADREDGQPIRIRCAIQRCERGGFGGVGYSMGATFQQVIQDQPLHLNEDEQDAHGQTTGNHSEIDAAVLVQTTGIKKAAMGFLKSLDPSTWLRKADDYSSVG